MQNNRILSSLGLAQKAGCIASGEYAVEKAVKGGLASLVIVAEDASDNTKKKTEKYDSFYETLCMFTEAKMISVIVLARNTVLW